MLSLLDKMCIFIAKLHSKFLSLNDAYEYNFTDKQLHFLIIGLFGMFLIFVLHPIFTLLAKTNHVMIISWLYVFTIILVITFAIEIGQGYSHSGVMDFKDIVFGVFGFMIMFAAFALFRMIVKGIIKLFKIGK